MQIRLFTETRLAQNHTLFWVANIKYNCQHLPPPGAMVIFKFTKPKVVNYEVIHYPQHHVEHHVDHHSAGWEHGPYQAR